MNISDIQKRSGARTFISIFGKSTVDPESREYEITAEATRHMLAKGYGVIHGGYAGGIMQAAADAAFEYLSENNLPLERNIAVPQREHDAVGWERVKNATFSDVADNIYERLHMVTGHSDIALVGPLGGDGTLLEAAVFYHVNAIAKYTGDRIVPLVFLDTEGGTEWREIFEFTTKKLDSSAQSLEDIEWIHFVKNLDELDEVIERYERKNELLRETSEHIGEKNRNQ